MKRFLTVILSLVASSASAQILNPGVIVFDEASQLGRARSLAFVGSTVSCGISGGAATCTFTAPSFTLTHNSTATSGCTAGAIFRSTSNLADCGAGLTYASGALIAGTATTAGTSTLIHNATIGGSSATSNFLNITGTLPATLSAETNALRWAITGNSQDQTQRGAYLTLAGSVPTNNASSGLEVLNSSTGYYALGIVGTSSGAASNSLGVYGRSAGTGTYNAGVFGVWGAGAANIGNAGVVASNSGGAGSIIQGFLNTTKVFEVDTNGATIAGGSGLGSTRVPLTARLGTGSTANVFEMQNSAGTVLSRFSSNGGLVLPSGSAANPALSFGGGNLRVYSSGSGGMTWNWANAVDVFYVYPDHPGGAFAGLPSAGTFGFGTDLFVMRDSAATFQLGIDVNGAAVNQTLKAHDGITGTDISGANMTIAAGRGTGSGAGGTIAFQTAPVLASGTTAQTPVDRLTIAKDGTIQVGANGTATSVYVGGTEGVDLYYYNTANAGLRARASQQYLRFTGGTNGTAFESSAGVGAGLWTATGLRVGDFTTPTAKFEVGGVSGTQVAATINNGTSTGNILNLQDNGTNVFAVADGGNYLLYRTVTAGATTGAQTINKPNGSVNFAAAATTLVVTNSLAGTSSLILVTPQAADATCTAFSVVRASGSFTITANAACTAETAVAFLVTN